MFRTRPTLAACAMAKGPLVIAVVLDSRWAETHTTCNAYKCCELDSTGYLSSWVRQRYRTGVQDGQQLSSMPYVRHFGRSSKQHAAAAAAPLKLHNAHTIMGTRCTTRPAQDAARHANETRCASRSLFGTGPQLYWLPCPVTLRLTPIGRTLSRLQLFLRAEVCNLAPCTSACSACGAVLGSKTARVGQGTCNKSLLQVLVLDADPTASVSACSSDTECELRHGPIRQ